MSVSDSLAAKSEMLSTSRIPWNQLTQQKLIVEGRYVDVWVGRLGSRRVAIKQWVAVNNRAASGDGTPADAISTFNVYCKIKHPNIVPFYGISNNGRKFCSVYEWQSRSLKELVQSEQKLPFSIVCSIGRDIGCALAYLHSENIQWTGVKDVNVFISDAYGAKINDFNIHALKAECSNDAKIGSDEACLGFRSPERWGRMDMSSSELEKSDIYSYGVLLWELYYWKRPYDWLSDRAIYECLQQTPPMKLPIATDCPRSYSILIRKCWNDIPAQRPKAITIEEGLERILRNFSLIQVA